MEKKENLLHFTQNIKKGKTCKELKNKTTANKRFIK